MLGELDADTHRRIREAGLEIGAVPIEELFIALTEKEAKP